MFIMNRKRHNVLRLSLFLFLCFVDYRRSSRVKLSVITNVRLRVERLIAYTLTSVDAAGDIELLYNVY